MHENRFKIRPSEFEDAEAIFNLIKQFPEEVLPRSLSDIVQNIDRFLVCEVNGKVVGTVSWQILPEIGAPRTPSLEIKSLAVSVDFSRKGIGRALVQGVIERMTKLHPAEIVALTFHPQFFEKLGFREVQKEKLMHKLYTGCINCTKYDSPFTCPEIAVVLEVKSET
jgi:amino-acid N-acetyltransferase